MWPIIDCIFGLDTDIPGKIFSDIIFFSAEFIFLLSTVLDIYITVFIIFEIRFYPAGPVVVFPIIDY